MTGTSGDKDTVFTALARNNFMFSNTEVISTLKKLSEKKRNKNGEVLP